VSKPKKLAQKGAFWDGKKFKIIPRQPAAKGALWFIDASRLSKQKLLHFATVRCTIVLSYPVLLVTK
jgi:hypothetical protein